MKKNTVLYIGIVAVAVYLLMFKKKKSVVGGDPVVVRDYALEIIKKGNSIATYQKIVTTFSQDFLKNWADASLNGAETFMYQGKTYLTKGGRAKR